MILNERNGLSFYQFPNLIDLPEVRHAVFTRQNGHSRKPYHSLNTSFGVGDDTASVKKNRSIIKKSLEATELLFVRQVHGTEILILPQQYEFTPNNPTGRPPVGDSLITNVRGRFLVVQVADCQPIFLYDTARQIVANIHSGWRGSIRNIIGQTINAMGREFGTVPQDIVAAIGPSLGPCCAEFIHYRNEIPKTFWSYKDKDHHFDFWALSRDQLTDAGVPATNIYSSDTCTRCNPERFFTYRGEGTTGRFAAVIGLI